MSEHAIVISVLHNLNIIKRESFIAVRRSLLGNYIKKIVGTEEYTLLMLVLSSQVSQVIKEIHPKFNTIPFEGIVQGIRNWFTHKDQSLLSFEVQRLLHLMSSSSTIGLHTKDIFAAIPTSDYVDLCSWFAENNIDIVQSPPSNTCPLCGIHSNKALDDVCDTCKENLRTFTYFRCNSFLLPINSRTCPWVTDALLEDRTFAFQCNAFTVTRVSTTEVQFTYGTSDNSHQGELPIQEYQRFINL